MTQPLDWGEGDYGPTGRTLVPAAETVVTIAAPQPGERVVDVGCGTGNVSRLAALAGATVTGVDPSSRLLERAAAAMPSGSEVSFARGDAAHIPLRDHSCDAVLSNFAVIFAPDPAAAVAELCRVATPSGRIVFSAWMPVGTPGALSGEVAKFLNETQGTPLPPPRYAWFERANVEPLFAAVSDRDVEITEHEIAFTGPSAEAYFDEVVLPNPVSLAGVAAARAAGTFDALRDRLLGVMRAANEDPDGFRMSSRYVVIRA